MTGDIRGSPGPPSGETGAPEKDQAHQPISPQDSRRTTAAQAAHTVYDGLRPIGSYRISRGRCVAYDVAGRALGVFPDHIQAVSAISKAARERDAAPAAPKAK